MPITLARTISKIQSIPNTTNSQLVKEMYEFLKSSGVSERHQHNALKVMIPFANYLGSDTTFFDINSKEPILAPIIPLTQPANSKQQQYKEIEDGEE